MNKQIVDTADIDRMLNQIQWRIYSNIEREMRRFSAKTGIDVKDITIEIDDWRTNKIKVNYERCK